MEFACAFMCAFAAKEPAWLAIVHALPRHDPSASWPKPVGEAAARPGTAQLTSPAPFN